MSATHQHSYTRGDAPGYVFNPTSGYVNIESSKKSQSTIDHKRLSLPNTGNPSNFLPPGVPEGAPPSYTNVNADGPSGTRSDLLQVQRRRHSLSQASRQAVPLLTENHSRRGSMQKHENQPNRPLKNNSSPTTSRSVAVVEPNRQNSPDETDGLTFDTVSIPLPKELRECSVESPPDCGPVGWKVVASCSVLNACGTIVILMLQTCLPDMALVMGEAAKQTVDAFIAVRMMAAPVSVLFVIYAGYRRLCMVGGTFIGIGFFISGFVSSSSLYALIGFLIAGLAGVGMSFWYVTVIIVLLEYFDSGRLLALILSHVGTLIGTFIMVGIKDAKNGNFVWETAFKCQVILAAVGIGMSLLLHPLPLKSKHDRERTFLADVVDALDANIFKNRLLCFLIILLFLDQLARPIPMAFIPKMMTNITFSSDEIRLQPFMEPSGAFVGMLFLIFWRKRGVTSIFFVWGLFNIFIGYLTFQIPDLIKFPWLITYSVAFGVNEVVILLLFHHAVPDLFGRLNIRVVEGIAIFTAGLGRCASIPTADHLTGQSKTDFTEAFYLSGGLFIGTGVLIVLLRVWLMLRDHGKKIELLKDKKSPKESSRQTEMSSNTYTNTRTEVPPHSVARSSNRQNEIAESDIVEIEIQEIGRNSTAFHM